LTISSFSIMLGIGYIASMMLRYDSSILSFFFLSVFINFASFFFFFYFFVFFFFFFGEVPISVYLTIEIVCNG
jgi:hypothetical protein